MAFDSHNTRGKFRATERKPFVSNRSSKKPIAPCPDFPVHVPRIVSNPKPEPSSDDKDAALNAMDHQCLTDLPAAVVSEILSYLEAKELGVVSCVSTVLNSLASHHDGWKSFYCERWGLPVLGTVEPRDGQSNPHLLEDKSWKDLFVQREFQSKSFLGRFNADYLHGHAEAVRAVFVLVPAKLIFTGGYDSVLRIWDMELCVSVSASRPLGCTIRAITADPKLLVAAGTDAFIQCWRSVEGHPTLFDVSGPAGGQNGSEFRLWGHNGPVTCLALDSSRIYSGSWDMTVRVWDRFRMKCVARLGHSDWVWALSPRGSTMTTTAGRDVYMWDIATSELIMVVTNAHTGNAYAVARTHTGDLLFTGGEDGTIHMFAVSEDHDCEDVRPTNTWKPHSGPVNSLAFEYPWLVSSSSDGRIALIDIRKFLIPRRNLAPGQTFKVKRSAPGMFEPPQRMLQGSGCSLFSVDIGGYRVVCGGDMGTIKVWDFSQALEIEKRVQAARGLRLEHRMRRRTAQMEMNGKAAGRGDQCTIAAAKKNQLNNERGGNWRSKRGVKA